MTPSATCGSVVIRLYTRRVKWPIRKLYLFILKHSCFTRSPIIMSDPPATQSDVCSTNKTRRSRVTDDFDQSDVLNDTYLFTDPENVDVS